MNRPRRTANSHLAARSVVRLIEAMKQPEPDAPINVIMKPKEVKKRLPGVALLMKLSKQREKEREKRKADRVECKQVDEDVIDAVISGIFEDLEI